MSNTKSPFYVPTQNANSWQALLADPVKHWKDGYSAKMMAECWESASGFPPNFKSALDKANLKLDLILGLPEHQVDLDNAKRPSQNDLFVLARDIEKLYAISVEGKVSEDFGPLILEWYQDPSEGKVSRLVFLLKTLELFGTPAQYNNLHYQLFHRTASAILMAKKLHAKSAMMVVHSFSDADAHFQDFADFAKLYDDSWQPQVGEIKMVKRLDSGIDLWLGWVKN